MVVPSICCPGMAAASGQLLQAGARVGRVPGKRRASKDSARCFARLTDPGCSPR